MTVSDLMKVLGECKPDAVVNLFVPIKWVDMEAGLEGDYMFEPKVSIGWATDSEGKADFLSIEVDEIQVNS